MKFTDGYWQLSENLVSMHPSQARDLRADAESGTLTAWAPDRPIRRRGDTLNRSLMQITYSSPAPDVVKVSIRHHTGGAPGRPGFTITGEPSEIEVGVDETGGHLRSGRIEVHVASDPWHVTFSAEGRVLTSSGEKGVGFILDTHTGERYVHDQLDLGVRDLVYGLGERFGPLVKNGQVVDIWNADGGTASEQAYKNVPFYVTTGGYGVLVDQPEKVSFEVGSEKVGRVQFSVPGEALDYYVIYGPTPKEVLTRYTALTGRPARVPDWSYGLWLSTSFTTSYDEATVTSFVDGMAERGIPLSVFHFDCFWMREFHWCDFVWDPATFPDPEGLLRRLHERDLRVCVWINPYIAQRSHLFEEGKALGYLVKRADGSVWQWDMWQAGMGLVDFTNPGAVAWFREKLGVLLDQGVDCFKTDFGERIPTDVVWHDGSDPERMHNYYTHLYNKTVFDLLVERRGEGEAVLFARSATVGGQQFPVHWGGDCYSELPNMAESLRGGLSLAASGFGYWSHDIGGFEGTPDPAVFKRWVAFGLLSSHSRLHGSDSYRVPWAFDEEAVEVMRQFTRLKMRLLPYLSAVGEEAHDHGWPMMRPMVLEFPDDRGAHHVETQYMLGERLLVAPVFTADGDTELYVPEGTWTSLLDGSQVTGPRWVRQQHSFDSLPLLVRPDTVLPWGSREDRPDYDHAEGVTLRLFEIADGHRSVTRVGRGAPGGQHEAQFTVTRHGSRIRVEADHAAGAWALEHPASGRVEAAAGETQLELNL